VVVTVRDDGPGMADEVRAKAFEPFFKSEESPTGSGLGLSLVQRILEAHGAEATIESSEGGGTRVTFSLEAAEDPTR
jgi:signal transduction histidine kinase